MKCMDMRTWRCAVLWGSTKRIAVVGECFGGSTWCSGVGVLWGSAWRSALGEQAEARQLQKACRWEGVVCKGLREWCARLEVKSNRSWPASQLHHCCSAVMEALLLALARPNGLGWHELHAWLQVLACRACSQLRMPGYARTHL